MEKRRLIIGGIAILAIALYIWIAYFEIPSKVKKGEENIHEESWMGDIYTYQKGEDI